MISENKLAYSLIRVCCGNSIRCENFMILKPVLIVTNKALHMEYLVSSSTFVVNFPSMNFCNVGRLCSQVMDMFWNTGKISNRNSLHLLTILLAIDFSLLFTVQNYLKLFTHKNSCTLSSFREFTND